MIPDASALLAYMLDEPGEERVDRALENATFIDTVNLAEVLSTLVEFGRDPGSVIQALTQARVLGQSLTVRPLDETRALEIARLRPLTRAADLSLADRACLALAASLDLPALTADRAWAELNSKVRGESIR